MLVVDLQTGAILMGQQADVVLPAGGLTRLLTVGAALTLQPSVAESTLIVAGQDIATNDDEGFDAGTVATFDELAAAALVAGRPEAARAIAREIGASSDATSESGYEVFANRANELFDALGFTGTQLAPDEMGASTSVKEIASLLLALFKSSPELQDVLARDQAMVDGRSVASPIAESTVPVMLSGGVIADEGTNLAVLAERGNRTLLVVGMQVNAEAWGQAVDLALQSATTALATPGALESLPRLTIPNLSATPLNSTFQAVTTSANWEASNGTVRMTSGDGVGIDRSALRWPLLVLSLIVISAVIAVQRQALRQPRWRKPRRSARSRRQGASAAQQPAAPAWSPQQQPSSSGD